MQQYKTITDAVLQQCRQVPQQHSIEMGERSWTYQELERFITDTAHHLQNLYPSSDMSPTAEGFADRADQQKWERPIVALYMGNSMEFLICFLALIRLGWVAAPLDKKWSMREVRKRIEHCQPIAIVGEQKDLLKIEPLPVNCRKLITSLVGVQVGDQHQAWEREEAQKLRTEGNPLNWPDVHEEEDFYLGYTSGSTGHPKGFLRSHRSWLESFEACQTEFGIKQGEVVLVLGPLVHSLFLFAAIYTLTIGGTLRLSESFSAREGLANLVTGDIETLFIVPTMAEALLKELPLHPLQDFSAVQLKVISSGAKWYPEAKRRFQEQFPKCRIYEFYGASELSFVSILRHDRCEEKDHSVGQPFSGVQVSIRDEKGQEVKRGKSGLLFVKSGMTFSGYLDENRRLTKAKQYEWLTVGDIARMDEDGFLYLQGRQNNVMISGGLNIFPEEVEQILLAQPGIDEAIVVGVPDQYWGECVTAIIVRSNQALGKETIHHYCQQYLSRYKCPKVIQFWDHLPKTSTGKIARAKVKQLVQEGRMFDA